MSSWNERTPLLSSIVDRHSGTPLQRKTRKQIYLYVFGFLFILISLVYTIRNTLPTPLSDVEASKYNSFPGIHSYNEYLSHFNTPHSANQRGNEEMKEWIIQLAREFKVEASKRGIPMEIIEEDPTDLVSKRNKFTSDEYWLVESRNIIIRLTGASNTTEESYLINAHYDSVSTSHGVTDNGMGTAVALELLRYFVHHPPKHTVIFLFNNFEEGGLIGADAFVHHPWFSSIKLFVNLEGTGAGGRALLFRSSSLAAVQGLAKSKARFVHASPLGNDLLQAKLLKSDTDYTTFAKHGVPGLDFAFYYPRSHYHTQRDDLAHTTPHSLQHMGQMALATVLSIDSSSTLLPQSGEPEHIIYYDILGRFMLAYSFFTCQLLNILALTVVPVGLCVGFWWSHKTSVSDAQELKKLLKRQLRSVAQGFLATVVAVLFMIVLTALSAWVMLMINPSSTYGSSNSVVLYLAGAAFLGLLISQWVLLHWVPSVPLSLTRMEVGFYGLTAFWWVLLALATYLGCKKVAAIYFAIYFFISSVLATLVLENTDPVDADAEDEQEESEVIVTLVGRKVSRFWSIAFVIQTLMPVILMSEFLFLTMDSMRHTTADGTPESTLYALFAVPIMLIVLHLLPWVHAAGEIQKTTFCCSAVFILLFLGCALSQPFNGGSSPNRIVFNQEYNTTDSLATVALITGSSFGVLERTLKDVLPPSELDTLTCEPYMTYQTRCTYQTELAPMYARDEAQEVSQLEWTTLCDVERCRVNITSRVEHSLICQLQFTNTDIRGLEAWVNGRSIEKKDANETMHAITVYSKKQQSTLHWDLAFDANQVAGQAQFSCVYDDWVQGELPAFTRLKNSLPYDALLTIKGGVGLAKVHYLPLIPLN
ncbi:hypothetical protein BDF20DRAFT_836713 [Mycotypha africana]|uniref:uncharacterized protein n=1 Tax=Mycotypha africana TaxID=64632 RepID=UPI0022FFEC3D|nr:uncharacterized protein BDF20DRAFT_836713 [Mycotypha africana]KAI8975297.1 hypothetical protein BDF20DRAFT_836713 [Mycotypha africana]